MQSINEQQKGGHLGIFFLKYQDRAQYHEVLKGRRVFSFNGLLTQILAY
jgi:hypothetical protein